MALLDRDVSRESAGERRSAACVKACEGIPTELLELGFILRLIAACVHVKDDRVCEVLEELALHRLQSVGESRSVRSRRPVTLARLLSR